MPTWDKWPKCFYCTKLAYKVRVKDNRLVCKDCQHKA